MVAPRRSGELNIGLDDTLGVSTVQCLHAELSFALDESESIVLDGSAVSQIDTAALQVLVGAFICAESRRCRVTLRSPSEVLLRSAKLLGIDKYIGLKNR